MWWYGPESARGRRTWTDAVTQIGRYAGENMGRRFGRVLLMFKYYPESACPWSREFKFIVGQFPVQLVHECPAVIAVCFGCENDWWLCSQLDYALAVPGHLPWKVLKFWRYCLKSSGPSLSRLGNYQLCRSHNRTKSLSWDTGFTISEHMFFTRWTRAPRGGAQAGAAAFDANFRSW
jgi:hypothetical protein